MQSSKGDSSVEKAPDTSLDPITFTVLRHAFEVLVDEMGVKIEQAAYSPVVNQGRDFAGSITTADGRLVAQGDQDLPAFVGLAPVWVKNQIDWIGIENFKEGDIVIANDPYMGGTHCMDVRFMMPVYWEGELIAFLQDIAHWVDIGGPMPGGFNPAAKHILQEAMRITPVHIVREGKLDENVAKFILANVRLPDSSFGDMMGQIEALKVGERRMKALLEKYGKETIKTEMEDLIRHSERLMREEFAKMPNGVYTAIDYIDRDPASDSDEPLKIHLDITIEGDRLLCDLSKSSPQALGPVNAPMAVSISSLMCAIKSMFPHIPMNEGVHQSIDFNIPLGLVCSCVYPAPNSGMGSGCYARVLDCVYRCFVQIVPEKAMACPYTIINITAGGTDCRPGYNDRPFVLYSWVEGGYGGRPGKKDNHTAMSLFASGTKNIPMELMEIDYPVRWRKFEYLQDSEGAGKHRGGFGVAKDLVFTCSGASITCQGDREKHIPWGYAGGLDSSPNTLRYAVGTKEETHIGVFAVDHPLEPGKVVGITTNGGGGFGHPIERPVEWVLEDVIDELVSLNKAREVYGVVINVVDKETLDYEVDYEATQRLRDSLMRR